MKIKLSGIVPESIVDGPGFRMAIFTQGCPHGCPGCHNPQTHDPEGGEWADTQSIIDEALDNELLDGITLSGGEPFAQPEACVEIAKACKAAGLSVWSYSGYTYEVLLGKPEWRALLETVDVLVDGPFILEQKSLDVKWRGSRNQRLIDVPKSLAAGKIIEKA